MRKDEKGNRCPETLGEYRDLCEALGGEDCAAVEFLDNKIKDQGRDEKVMQPDSQMRAILMPMIIRPSSSSQQD